jgi:DNA modification methylase
VKIEMWDIHRVKPYEQNPRHNDAAVDAVIASIREFGWRQPIVVDADGVIIVGHTRHKAAVKMGLKKVPVHVATDLSPAQIKAYRIADNQTATIAEWDKDLLPLELAGLKELNFDIGLLGFGEEELQQLMSGEVSAGLCDPDDVPAPPDEAITQPGDLWILGDHRLICGDSSNPDHVDRLLDGARVQLVNTDPPYNVKVEPRSNNAIAAGLSSFESTHHQKLDVERYPGKAKGTTRKMRAKDRPLANDFVSDEQFDRLLDAWFGNIARVLDQGRGFYIWGGYANCGNYPPFLKKHELYFSQAVIWVKEHPVLTRKDFMGNHEWCQPGDTKVETPHGPVPINSLREGDRVISYSRNHHAMVGLRSGLAVSPTSRHYQGPLLGVRVGRATTWCTPGHLWSVKLSSAAAEYWCVYLMRRGAWWRVGKSKFISTWGFGIKHRLKTEGGEEAWILSVHQSNVEATLVEQCVLAEYGVPTTTWSESAGSRRTLADISRLYDRLDLAALQRNAVRLLADHGRSVEHPFLRIAHTRPKVGRRTSLLVRGCNLLPQVVMIPVPAGGQESRWQSVDAIERHTFEGDVYSMDVEGYGHYVADGLVTHNCFYGWREGAAHRYYGPNNATDTWHVKKVNPQSMVHLTEKPVELAVRAMQYSSLAGENVLDLFGGSGSTLIAAEQTGRKAFLMELDPPYCDVIVQRFEQFTGKKAERIEAKDVTEKTPAARAGVVRGGTK